MNGEAIYKRIKHGFGKAGEDERSLVLSTRAVREGLAGVAVPVTSVGKIRLLTVQVSINPHGVGIRQLLDDAVDGVSQSPLRSCHKARR